MAYFFAIQLHETCIFKLFNSTKRVGRGRTMKLTEISVEDAAQIMRMSPQFIRDGMKDLSLPIGETRRESDGRLSYTIYKEKLWDWLEFGDVYGEKV